MGHHRPPSKTPLNGVSLAGRCWPNIECWLGSFVIFQGILTSIAKTLNFCDFSGEGGPNPLSSLQDPPMCTIKITSTNTADSDEIPHDLESQQGLPCLLKIQRVCNVINPLYTNGFFLLV